MAVFFSALWSSFSQNFYRNLITDDRWFYLLSGLSVTLRLTFYSVFIGTALGTVLCFMKISGVKPLSAVASAYITFFRGTPTVVQLLIIYFGVFASVSASKVMIASIAFGMNSGAYIAEILRGGILSVDRGQTEAGRSLGLGHWQTMFSIILPQAFKTALPTYANECITLLKETSIAGYIALEDLTKVGDFIRGRTYSAWFIFLTVAFTYLFLTTAIGKFFSWLEGRLRKSDIR